MLVAAGQQPAFADDVQEKNWGEVTNGVRMCLQLDESCRTNPASQNIMLLLSLENLTTNTTFLVYESTFIERDLGYTFEIVFPSGKKVIPSHLGGGSGSTGLAFVKPQRRHLARFNLSTVCDFNEVGTYQIILTRSLVFPKSTNFFMVKSNPLEFHYPFKPLVKCPL